MPAFLMIPVLHICSVEQILSRVGYFGTNTTLNEHRVRNSNLDNVSHSLDLLIVNRDVKD